MLNSKRVKRASAVVFEESTSDFSLPFTDENDDDLESDIQEIEQIVYQPSIPIPEPEPVHQQVEQLDGDSDDDFQDLIVPGALDQGLRAPHSRPQPDPDPDLEPAPAPPIPAPAAVADQNPIPRHLGRPANDPIQRLNPRPSRSEAAKRLPAWYNQFANMQDVKFDETTQAFIS